MNLVRIFFLGHLAALIFGLAGLLIAVPNAALWSGQVVATRIFNFGMTYGGATHIIFGAATMFVFGLRFLGARRTLIFFGAAYLLSLTMEMLGTGTGWPFGAYSYTDFLGYKIGGQVPFTIPLSWFYLGFATYLLGTRISQARGWKPVGLWSVVLGGWLLTVWDLVLDPAMAHESLSVKFWMWHETGSYFGMPLHNFAGWTATGLLFMGLSRLLWRDDPAPTSFPTWLPLAIYIANLAFASALSLSVGLAIPVLLAAGLGLLPLLGLWERRASRSGARRASAQPAAP